MPQQVISRKPEIMSPAGYWPQLQAAIEAGADAVYFGLKHFSARAKVGFSLAELPEVVQTLHKRGVRGYITFNTLVFEHELRDAVATIAAIAEAGIDALIIQDVGVVRLAREVAPALELHASTQMSITNAEGVRLAQSLGIQRVTLARELSLKEIAAIIADTQCDLEMFVHGALCVAYSGQCFSSEAWGGRSANRGQCAQACRLPYELVVDGVLKDLADARYLLSPGDLTALDQVPEIVRMGVAALKIEGRYKDADYVALTTRAYRNAVDDARAGVPSTANPAEKLLLEQAYSRGLGPFFISGTNHQAVVRGRAPRHRGVLLGQVTKVQANAVLFEAAEANRLAPVKPGDGIVFDAADWRSPEEPEEGGRVYEVQPGLGGDTELRFGNGAIDFDRIRAGDLVWRTHDPDVEREARAFTNASAPVRRQVVDVNVRAHENELLVMEWRLAMRPDLNITVYSSVPLGGARRHAPSIEFLREQLGRLGNTAYVLGKVDLDIGGAPFMPASLLNQLRREAVEALQRAQAEPVIHEIHPQPQILGHATVSRNAVTETLTPELHILVRTAEQFEAALELRPASITLDYLDLYGLRLSVERTKSAGIEARVASPRVLKPGEGRIANFLVSLDCPIVVRSGGLVEALKLREQRVLIGDFSLNAANSITAETYLDLGLLRITPTHDLNAEQIASLADRIGPEHIEAVAYQHLPVFHTEHCVFCRFLSSGTSYRDCGRPCEEHVISVRDQAGRSHPVIADVGCRNTVFGAEAQEASLHLNSWRRAGIRHFRLEFVHESGEQVRRVYRAFERALSGSFSFEELGVQLRRLSPEGTSEGSLFVPNNYMVLPVLQ
jgi:putative protease